MPVVKVENLPQDIGLPDDFRVTTTYDDLPEQPSPKLSETLGAAFRTENIVGSYLASEAAEFSPYTDDGEYNAAQDPDIIGGEYDQFWEKFQDVRNRKYADALKAQIKREAQDRRTLEAAGGVGFLASMAAGVIDLPTLIPGGVVATSAKGGFAVGKAALSVAGAAALDATVSEIGLQATQELRTPQESAINIAASTVLGGLIGAGTSKLMSVTERAALEAKFSDDLIRVADPDLGPSADDMARVARGLQDGADVGAARVQGLTKEQLSIDGKAAQALSNVGFNPMIRLSRSPSKAAKEVAANLPEMSVYLKMTGDDISQPQAVETYVKRWTLGAVGDSLSAQDTIFKEMKKSGIRMPRREFSERVGRAMRRGDIDPDGNEFVSRAARKWRETVFDPLKKEAIDAGLLPEDVSVDTAMSYFSRMYNRNKIEANEQAFKGIVRKWARDTANEQFYRLQREIADAANDAQKVADLQRQLDDIKSFRLDGPEGEDYINEVADEIFNKITGRENVDVPIGIVSNKRGPLKERTFNISDELIEDYLESDVEMVGRRYARVMGADVEMTRKFGKADMKDQITKLQREYTEMRAKVEADSKLSPESKRKQLKALNDSEKADKRDIEALRDRLRGTYLLQDRISGPGRFVNAVNTFNYLRAMGGVTLSSLPDVGRAIMVHGVGRWMRDGIVPLISDLKGFKLSVKEAKLAGAAAELVNNSRMATLAELTDPYAFGHPFERFLHNTSTGFSKLNGMVYWNDFQKSFASVITQSRILDNAEQAFKKGFKSLPPKERKYMAFLGLGEGDAERIGKLFNEAGETRNSSIRIAHMSDWGADAKAEYAKRIYMAAVNKDVDSIIVTKGIGDTPLLADTNTGRMLLQFKSFMLASHQRMLMRGVQEDAAGMLSGLMVSMGIGMMVFAAKQMESNREIPDNPGRWLAEGVDRSGILGPMMEFNNIGEKVTGVGLYSALQAPFAGSKKGPASRYAIRSTVGSVLGPSFGAATDIVGLVGSASRGDFTESDINAIGRLMPGRSLPILRSLLEYYAFPEAREAVR
jgi:hypothetical protein